MAEDIANILDIHVKYVPYATEIADRVLIIYTDGEYEIHESKELIAV
jgi:hypothetical protein